MNLDNRIIYHEDVNKNESNKYWTFDEVIGIINRNDPDELFKNEFIVNFRDGSPVDGYVANREISYMNYLINNTEKLSLKNYYMAMTRRLNEIKLYTHKAHELVNRTLSREIHILESIPRSTYNDLYNLIISKLPQDGSVNIFEFIRCIPIDNLMKLRTDLTKYDYSLLVKLARHEDFNEVIDYIDIISEQVKDGNDLDIVIEAIKEVSHEFI